MHIEIQVALNFLISFLYNKLPRRRVNQLGEELEKALKVKFEGHWYPEKPFKGSAFRCLKTAPPLEPVFEVAAREAGMELSDIQENLPKELSIWVDPGEVSYRMGEKLPVKILYSDGDPSQERPGRGAVDREVTRTFNPEAQCFKPIDSLSSQLAGLGVQTNGNSNSANNSTNNNSVNSSNSAMNINNCVGNVSSDNTSPLSPDCSSNSVSVGSPMSPGSTSASTSPTSCQTFGNMPIAPTSCNSSTSSSSSTASSPGSVSPTSNPFRQGTTSTNSGSGSAAPAAGTSFLGGKTPALTFTTAAFAQTKFGSTKLKTNSKRSHRMSPTEFSAYIKQRAILQQQQQQQQQHSAAAAMFVAAAAASSAAAAASNGSSHQSGRPRSLSPMDPGYMLVGPQGTQGHQNIQASSNSQQLSASAFHQGNIGPFGSNSALPSTTSSVGVQSGIPAPPHVSNRGFGVFDHGYLGDLFAAAAAGTKLNQRSMATSLQQPQQQGMTTSRYSPVYHMQEKSPLHLQMDAFACMSGSQLPNGGNLLPASSMSVASPIPSTSMSSSVMGTVNSSMSPGSNKQQQYPPSHQQQTNRVDTMGFNLQATYPNQYQHLLVAN